MEVTCYNLLEKSVAGDADCYLALLPHANRVRCCMCSEPPEAVSLVVIRCSYQASLVQPVHSSTVGPWFPSVTGSGTRLAVSTSLAASSPFLSCVFPGPPPQLWFWASVLLLPCWIMWPRGFKNGLYVHDSQICISSPSPLLKEKVEWSLGYMHCQSGWEEALGKSGGPQDTQVTHKERIGPPAHLPIRHLFGFKIKYH